MINGVGDVLYRYDDINDAGNNGSATLTLSVRFIVRETNCYWFHVPAVINKDDGSYGPSPYGRERKTLKIDSDGQIYGGMAKYRPTREMALCAYRNRKNYQLSCLRLSIQRILAIEDKLKSAGALSERKLESLGCSIDAGETTESRKYTWGEY